MNSERCDVSTSRIIVEYKDSQQYVVLKIENKRQTALFKYGYFNSGTSLQNSIIEEAFSPRAGDEFGKVF